MKPDEKRIYFAFRPESPEAASQPAPPPAEPTSDTPFPLPPMHPESLLAQGWNWIKEVDTREAERLRFLLEQSGSPSKELVDQYEAKLKFLNLGEQLMTQLSGQAPPTSITN